MEATLHMPSINLKPKVPSTGGPDLKDIVENAEKALANMEGDYEIWVSEDIRQINEYLDQAKNDKDKLSISVKEIHAIGHNIKGQAATFSYPLLTATAKSLCHFIQETAEIAGKRLDLIEAHVDTLRMIILQGMKGSGGMEGQALVSALENAVQKILEDESKA